MPVTLKSAHVKYKDSDGHYVGINSVSDNTTAEQVAQIQSAGTTQINAVAAKGAQTLASIPQDYTTLSNDVGDLTSAFDSDIKLAENGYQTFFGFGNFQHYGLTSDGTFKTDQKYRVSNNDPMTFDRALTISVESGFRWGYIPFTGTTPGSWVGWKTSDFTIPAGTSFVVQIARTTEDTSEVADVAEFLSKIKFKSNYAAEIDKCNSRITKDENEDRNAVTGLWKGYIGLYLIDNTYINNSTGEETPYNGWQSSDFVDLMGAESITVQSSVSSIYNCWYDANKAKTGSNFTVGASAETTLSVPSGAKYIRLSNTAAGMANTKVYIAKGILDNEKSLNAIVADYYPGIFRRVAKIFPYTNVTNLISVFVPQSSALSVDAEFFFPKDWGIQYADDKAAIYFSSDVTYPITIESPGGAMSWTLLINVSTKAFKLIPAYSKRNIDQLGEYWYELFTFSVINTTKKIIDANNFNELIANSVLNRRIKDIEDNTPIFSPTTVEELNIDMVSFVINSNRKYSLWGNQASVPSVVSMAVFTDIHGYNSNFLRYLSFCDTYSSYITERLCLGDMVSNWYGDDITYWNDNPDGAGILRTIGNHDVWQRNSSPVVNVAQSDAFGTYFSGRMSTWGVTRPANADENYLMYYYKDYADQKLRLIVVDCMYWDANEKTWFESVLADALTNEYNVVCASHYNLSKTNMTPLADFYSLDYGFSNLVIGSGGSQALNAVDGFIASGGKFIAWMSGDSHYDACGIYTGQNSRKQISLTFENAGLNSLWNDSDRVEGTKTQDCFNIVSFDTYSKLLKVVRIGNSTDRYLRVKNYMTINYETCEVITHG